MDFALQDLVAFTAALQNWNKSELFCWDVIPVALKCASVSRLLFITIFCFCKNK
jgi:hypothetical protein